MNKKEDGFELFYNEFKDWTKKQLLHRTYDIILKDTEEIGEKDKEIEKLNKENKILKETLYTIWNKEIDIDYDKLQKAINDIKNMQKEADKQLKNNLHKMIFGSDDNE